MRKRVVTTVLTIGGVLVAGSAAALVNSSLLGNESSAMIVGRSANDDLGGTSVPGDSVAPVTGTSLPSTPVRRSETAAEYAVGLAGSVTIDTAGGALTVIAADPAAGWKVVDVADGDEVRVVFRSSTTDVSFRARMLYGVVSTSMETRSRPVSPGDDGPDESEVDDDSGDDHGTDTTVDDDDDDDVDEPDDTEVDDDAVDDDAVDDTVEDDKNDD